MFLTNNIKTYINLTFYSRGIYRKRVSGFNKMSTHCNYLKKRNTAPYGNINKSFMLGLLNLYNQFNEKK